MILIIDQKDFSSTSSIHLKSCFIFQIHPTNLGWNKIWRFYSILKPGLLKKKSFCIIIWLTMPLWSPQNPKGWLFLNSNFPHGRVLFKEMDKISPRVLLNYSHCVRNWERTVQGNGKDKTTLELDHQGEKKGQNEKSKWNEIRMREFVNS